MPLAVIERYLTEILLATVLLSAVIHRFGAA